MSPDRRSFLRALPKVSFMRRLPGMKKTTTPRQRCPVSDTVIPATPPEQRKASRGSRGAAMSPPGRRQDGGEILAGGPRPIPRRPSWIRLYLLLKGVVDELAVLAQVANDGMLLQEGKRPLRRGLALEQRAQGPQPIRAVGKGDGAGFFQGFARVPAGQVQQALEHAHAFDAARLDHRLGPTRRLRADTPRLAQQPGSAALDATDLLGGKMRPLRAEPARLTL